MIKKARLAVSAIFIYKNKILFIKRQPFLKSFPGYTAFPGGKVEQGESLREALDREIFEELGLSLKNLEQKKIVTSIKEVGKATSPSFNPTRFETYFFTINLTSEVDLQPCSNEFDRCDWLSIEEFISLYEKGELLIVKPIRMIAEHVLTSGQEYMNIDKLRDEKAIPEVENIKGIVQIMPFSNTLPPAERTNSFLIGDTSKVLVDPSPRDRDELKSFLLRLKKEKIDKIFITHHHGDHHQFSPEISQTLKIPLYISKDSYERVKLKWGESYFNGVDVNFSKQGDFISIWLGEKVSVYEIPGHDEGHLGLAPKSMKWFLVGDLFQGVGSVVVGDNEGDMKKYFQSLERVISLSPSCVIPSHGIPLGSSYILKKTLEHRIAREKEIKDLYLRGNSVEDILRIVYSFVPAKVQKYALKNIKSHLKKLHSDGEITVD